MTSFVFDGALSRGAGQSVNVSSPQNTDVTLVDDDGVLSVGDAITFTRHPDEATGSRTDGFNGTSIRDGDILYYLGTLTLPDSGQLGYVFGAGPNPGNTTEFVMMVDTLPLNQPTPTVSYYALSDVDERVFSDFVNNPGRPGALGNEPACFLQGTRISTPNGEVPIEILKVGDLIATADGGTAAIRWVGRQTLVKIFMGERARLVKIAAGALGNHADLFVTGDHGMLLEGYIINASALVNGSSINWVPLADTPERQVVYHIETDEHDIILANGAASETYLDNAARKSFDNYAELEALSGEARVTSKAGLPRISSARLVPQTVKRMTSATPTNV